MDQILQKLNDIDARLTKLETNFQYHQHIGSDSIDLSIPRKPADIGMPNALTTAPLGAITAPSGGVTQDSQARTAINTIISRIQALGLTS